MHNHTNVIVEVKSCTLCHNGLAMFPDAPTLRGQKHLVTLEQLATGKNPPLPLPGRQWSDGEYTPLPPSRGEYKTYVIFLILNASAERFMPNFHTDFDYGTLFLDTKAVNFKAFRLTFLDPVSADLQSIQEVPIDFSTIRTHCQNKGSYLLVLENPEDITVTVGKLGDIHFRKGWYVYVGSALQALDSRIKRHQKKRKKLFWHIDYIASTVMKVKKVYPIRRLDRMESELACALGKISDGCINHFGSTDAQDISHLFYFQTFPLKHREFVDIIFNARTF
jgi:sugar fermentation stimulation protein A